MIKEEKLEKTGLREESGPKWQHKLCSREILAAAAAVAASVVAAAAAALFCTAATAAAATATTAAAADVCCTLRKLRQCKTHEGQKRSCVCETAEEAEKKRPPKYPLKDVVVCVGVEEGDTEGNQ